MSFLTDAALTLESYSLPELAYQWWNGKPSPVYDSIQDLQIQQSVAAAGGGRAAIDQAGKDTAALRLGIPTRDPFSALLDLLKGNPATTAPNQPVNWVNTLFLFGIIALFVWGTVAVLRKVL